MTSYAPEPNYRCRQCLDDASGWIVLGCPQTPCGRPEAHMGHTFAVRCPHWLQEHADGLRAAIHDALQHGKKPSPACMALQELDLGVYPWMHARTERATWAETWERTRTVHI